MKHNEAPGNKPSREYAVIEAFRPFVHNPNKLRYSALGFHNAQTRAFSRDNVALRTHYLDLTEGDRNNEPS